MSGCCNGYTRAQVLRQAAAEAGNGLPAVEPGMPLPAGTGLSRRSFLLRSAGLALTVYGADKLASRALEEGVAYAADSSDRILVSVYMEGGIDSLSVLAPTEDSRYRAMRPTLALPAGSGTPFSEDTRLRWHPSAAALAELHGEGKLTVFPAIGYAAPNLSHFTSQHFWEVGELDVHARKGWLGRYLEHAGSPDNPLQGLSLSNVLMPALATESAPVAAVSRPESYTFYSHGAWDPITAPMLKTLGVPSSPS
ncbi:MAG TPA: hypothetical protein VHG69_00685, partial [Thermoleophilaceae bacterium]|nr:hypothetical protein [Thermoleophilaceae bacterium]